MAWIADKAVDPSLPITDLWDRLIAADIIATYDDVEGPEKDESGNDIYILNTKESYTVEIIVNDKGHIEIGDIVKGALPPVVRKVEATTTDTGITAKAIVSRLKNGSVEYWYKISTENDSEYKKMNFVSNEEGAQVQLTPAEGTTYVIKAIAKNDAGEHELTTEITIGVKVKGLTLDKTTATVNKGSTLQLIPTITPEDAENKKLTWNSSNEAIATVDENGLVTGVASGNTVITATTTDGSNLSATCNILVPTLITGITLKTTESVAMTKTVILTATVTPSNATSKTVTWKSSNESIATVNSSGVVTGKAVGTANITATAIDGSGIVSNICTVTVKELKASDVVGQVIATTNNTTLKDENGNKIVVPAGFKIVPNGGTAESSKVDYTYNADGKPCVQDGIVVEDGEGNQFVWIPCRYYKE